MKENVVRGILAKVEGEKFVGIETVEFPSKRTVLDVMYKALDCDCVDHVAIPLGEHVFHVWVDDEGAISGRKSPYFMFGHQPIFGSLLFTGLDDMGDIKSLTDREELVLRMILSQFLEPEDDDYDSEVGDVKIIDGKL